MEIISGSNQERRQYKRIKRTFLARFGFLRGGFDQDPAYWDIVSLGDLSAGGTSFTYDKEINVGDSFIFRIPFPESGEFMQCLGSAVRAEKKEFMWHVGAYFTDIDPEKRNLINRTAEEIFYRRSLKMPPAPRRDASWVVEKQPPIKSDLA